MLILHDCRYNGYLIVLYSCCICVLNNLLFLVLQDFGGKSSEIVYDKRCVDLKVCSANVEETKEHVRLYYLLLRGTTKYVLIIF